VYALRQQTIEPVCSSSRSSRARGGSCAEGLPPCSLGWKKLYRPRGVAERENGRLKNQWALLPLRVRRLERVQLHADLTILAPLAVALDRA
jgi:hypothetical protein